MSLFCAHGTDKLTKNFQLCRWNLRLYTKASLLNMLQHSILPERPRDRFQSGPPSSFGYISELHPNPESYIWQTRWPHEWPSQKLYICITLQYVLMSDAVKFSLLPDSPEHANCRMFLHFYAFDFNISYCLYPKCISPIYCC